MAPAPGYVEQLQLAQTGGDGRIDDQVVVQGLEPEHGPQQQQRSSRRPGLRRAGRRILDRVPGHRPGIATERLGEPAVEEPGGIEDALGDAGRLVLEP